MTRTAIAFRHLAFEDLGCFGSVLEEFGFAIRYFEAGVDRFEEIETEPDLCVVLGGPIGAYDFEPYPFLIDETAFLRRRLLAGGAVVGICLGAQVMAQALGARVYPGSGKEIGFAPIHLTEAGERSCLASFRSTPLLHWHGDTFDLPEDAVLLASTDPYRNQAFTWRDKAIAFQFHPEAGDERFERWLIGHTLELSIARKDVPALRAEYLALAPELRRCSSACIRRWLSDVGF